MKRILFGLMVTVCAFTLAQAEPMAFRVTGGEGNLIRLESKAPLETIVGVTDQVSGTIMLDPADLTSGVSAAISVVPMLIALYGFGFAFAALVLLIREPNTLIDVSDFLVGLMSGRQFPVNVLPRSLLPVSLAIPLTYGFDAVRGYLLNAKTIIPIRYEVGILLLFMVTMVPAGYAVFRIVERHCRKLGTLGLH